ncbi:MAG: MTH1187 family thiamine-binding protein [Candidatus Njordarchaeales archaeon]
MARFIAEFSILPVGTGDTSLSKYVAQALRALKEEGISYTLTPMCTIIESDSIEEIFKAVRIAHEVVIKMGVKRVIIRINIDDRLDKVTRRAQDKILAVKEKMKEE